ncbi:MAG: serine/threonine-protein kinase [Herpetosiphonaceae bacterium]|nr:serine/threonine-protein kinase [Herpetosiphonaceae bacterium]
MIHVGDILQGRYTIVRPLGSGGFGSVFLATDSRLGGRQVAIKYFATAHMRPDEAAASAQLFQGEAHTLANLNHPNLTPVLDYFEASDGWVLVMAYVPGDSLASLQKRLNGPFGEEQVIEWAIELCNVLDFLHRQNPPLVFRDLKPSNIMRTPEGKVMLIDFGIVRSFKEGQHQDTVQLGTPGYAPPEQYGGQTEPRSDLYSLGATMYVLLTGERLTGGFAVPSVRERSSWVSPDLDSLIARLTALRPQERPDSAAAVRRELEQLQSNPQSRQFVAAPSGSTAPAPAVGAAPGPYHSTPDAPTMANPQISPRPQPQYQPTPQPQYQPPAGAAPRSQRGGRGWLIALVLVLLLGGAGGAVYALRDSLFGGDSDVIVVPTNPPGPDALSGSLFITSRPDPDGGAFDLLELPLSGGAARKIVPGHSDNAIADRRRSDSRLVYTHGVEQDGRLIEQIFTINLDGSDERQLTSGPGVNRASRWSPDGTRIVFESNRDQTSDNQRDIYLMDADGANLQRLTAEAGWQGGPAWSPDGTRIVFHSKTTDNYEIVLLDLASQQQFTLATLAGADTFWPDWSPDGSTVAFMTGSGNDTAIYTVPATGGTPKQLENLGAGVNRWPRWSPDGQYLAFESQRAGRWQVYLLSLADNQVRKVSDGTRNDRWPMW